MIENLCKMQGTVPTEEYNGADRSPAKPSCNSQTTRERRQSKFAFKGELEGWMNGWMDGWMEGWMDGKRQLYLISRHIAPSFPGGDKAGQGGGVYKGGSISCDWLDELTPHPLSWRWTSRRVARKKLRGISFFSALPMQPILVARGWSQVLT